MRIQLLIGLDDAYGRAVTRGIIRYAKGRPDWRLYGYDRIFSGDGAPSADGVPSPDGAPSPDGVIARVESPADARALTALPCPVVDVACAYPGTGLLEAYNDDADTGRRAGTYLKALGFRSFAFCGVEDAVWSRRRMRGFCEELGILSRNLARFERNLPWWKARSDGGAELEGWLRTLPVPAAVFACNDIAGLRVVEACAAAGIRVPEDLAVLGVDDEDLLCELADPSLSSIRLDYEGIGRAAAELLAEALEAPAGHPRRRELTVPPRDIVERESSRTAVHEDPLVARASAWLRANAHRPVDIGDLMAELPASRRTVENRFRAATGRTLHEALTAYRLERSRYLLRTTDTPLDDLAAACGIPTLQRFHSLFKAAEGCTPGLWRRRMRAGGR